MYKSLPYLVIIIIIIGAYITYIAFETVQMAANAIVWLIVVSLVVLIVSGLALMTLYLLMFVEKYLTVKEQRQKIGRDIITTNDGKVIIRDNDPHSTWRQIHLNPNPYVNGHYEQATEQQVKVFNAVMARRKGEKLPLLIEGQASEKQRTIFDVVDTGVHFSLIGATNSGKTTLANHIIDYLKTDKIYACDPHAKFNIWSSQCQIVQNYTDIQHTLHSAFVEMTSRYDQGPSNYESILIAIDEWPAIIAECPDCEQYISRISREGRKVNIRLLLLSQSDQIGEIGLSVALRNNFIKIELVPELTQQNKGSIKHWDKSKELIALAGPYEREMTFEKQVLDLWQKSAQTEDDITAICKIVYPGDRNYGGNQRSRVRTIIERERITNV